MMAISLQSLQLLLLDLLSSVRNVEQDKIDQLSPENWRMMLLMARQHRLLPMLHWQIKTHHSELIIDYEFAQACLNSYKKSTLRSLSTQRELVLLSRILAELKIAHIFLKGSYLAYFVYPQPGLRPLRDIDVLIPYEKIVAAFNGLLEEGFTRFNKFMSQGNPEAALEVSHHLPIIFSPSGNIGVELHPRLFHPEKFSDNKSDLALDPRFWARSIKKDLVGQSISFTSPTDLLLHLIVHAVYDHQFNNGPLILSDISFLLDSHEIDWSLFWELSYNNGYTRGFILMLSLTERYFGTKSIIWALDKRYSNDISEEIQETSALLMLRDYEMTGLVNLTSSTTTSKKITWAISRIFPSRLRLAAIYPTDPKSIWIYAYYPKYFLDEGSRRIAQLIYSYNKTHTTDEIKQLNKLNQWLEGQ